MDDALLPVLKALLNVEDPKQLGKGRDVNPYLRAYTRLELEAAWQCIAPDRNERYELEKKQVRRDISMLQSQGMAMQIERTKLDWIKDSTLDPDLNEKWLLHGTKPEFVLAMLQQGLNERITSMNGMLGAGVYLAEDAEKVDQYCFPDSGQGSPEFDELHRILFPNTPGAARHPAGPGSAPGGVNDLFYVFVVRALCGYTYHQDMPGGADRRELPEVPGSTPPVRYHSLIFDSTRFRYREFVNFHSVRTHIQYLLAYRRV